MRAIPVTTRLKSLAKELAVGKQTYPDPKAKIYGNLEGEDIDVTETVNTPKKSLKQAYADRGKEYKDLDFEAYSKVAKKDPLYGTSGGTKQITTTKKSDDIPFDGQLMTTTKGNVYKPTEVRRLSRSSKKAGRDVRRSEIKLSKYGTRSEDDKGNVTWKMKDGLSARKQAKFRENEKELKRAKTIETNVDKGIKSGKLFGSSYISGQRKTMQSEAGKDPAGEKAQKKMLEEKAKRDNLISSTNSGGQAGKAVTIQNEVNPNSSYERFTGQGTKDLINSFAPKALGETNTVKLASANNMKEKSIAYKTLKGNQKNLPEQLRKKIESAPGKLKSGFQMKGYGKR